MLSLSVLYNLFKPILLTKSQYLLIQQKLKTREQAMSVAAIMKNDTQGLIKFTDQKLLEMLDEALKIEFKFFLNSHGHLTEETLKKFLFTNITSQIVGIFNDGKLYADEKTIIDFSYMNSDKFNRNSQILLNVLFDGMVIGYDIEREQILLPFGFEENFHQQTSENTCFLDLESRKEDIQPWISFNSNKTTNLIDNAPHKIFYGYNESKEIEIRKIHSNGIQSIKFLDSMTNSHHIRIDNKNVLIISDSFEQRFKHRFLSSIYHDDFAQRDCYILFYTLILSQIVIVFNGRFQSIYDCADILIIEEREKVQAIIKMPNLTIYTGDHIKIAKCD